MEIWKKCAATGERSGIEVDGVGGWEGGEGVRAVDGEHGRDEGGGCGEKRGAAGEGVGTWDG